MLVHGLWMHGVAMRLMKRRFERCGYAVCVYSYPSVRRNLSDNAQCLAHYLEAIDAETVHVVAHSMGGIVAFRAAARVRPARGRLVMIGTPFADCFSGRSLERSRAGRWLLGRCMAQCLREPRDAPPDDLEIGVIAGDGGFGMGRIVARGLPRPHDGVVSVAETQVPGMRDHVVIHVSHTAMLVDAGVANQTCAFLERGRFQRNDTSTA